MTLADLKQAIQEQNTPKQFYIFVCPENFFVADQYVEAICEERRVEKAIVNSIYDQESALSLVLDRDEYLNIIKVDVFNEVAEDYSIFENTIVVCNKIDKKIESLVSDYVVKFPALVDWQIKDYIKQVCPELDLIEIDWLYSTTKNKDGIYRVKNELDKICLFKGPVRKQILAELKFDKDSDLYTVDIFKLSSALILGDTYTVLDYLKHRKTFPIELYSILGLTLADVKKAILVTQNSGKTAADLGMSTGQFNIIKSVYSKVHPERLKYLLNKLSSIDLKIKSGLLDISNQTQVDYLITQML